jgi:hypothetical protein
LGTSWRGGGAGGEEAGGDHPGQAGGAHRGRSRDHTYATRGTERERHKSLGETPSIVDGCVRDLGTRGTFRLGQRHGEPVVVYLRI